MQYLSNSRLQGENLDITLPCKILIKNEINDYLYFENSMSNNVNVLFLTMFLNNFHNEITTNKKLKYKMLS